MSVKKPNKKYTAWLQIFLFTGIIIAINIIFSVYYKRFDLTADHRYTLSEPTLKLVDKLEDKIYIKVYLEGKDLPPDFKRLQEATKDILDEFKQAGGDKIQYSFIDPEAQPDEKTKQDVLNQLAQQGLKIKPIQVQGEDKVTTKNVITGATVTYAGKTLPVHLLQEGLGNTLNTEILNNSTAAIEYQFANALRQLTTTKKQKLAFIQGHGELSDKETWDIAHTLMDYYEVEYVNLPKWKVGKLNDYAAIIVAAPDSIYTPLEKYKLDQYLMQGGKMLWFMDALDVHEDTLNAKGFSFLTDNKTDLEEEFLYSYGIRVNFNMVQDLQSHYYQFYSPREGKTHPYRWPFFPLVVPQTDHPIVSNLNPLWFQYAGTLDTIGKASSNLKKTVLLQTSPHTRVYFGGTEVKLSLVNDLQNPNYAQLYNGGNKNLAVLLEGSFQSPFVGMVKPEMLQEKGFGKFIETSSSSAKMLVVSDADIIRNRLYGETGYMKLGFDPYTNMTFGNKNFVLNCVDYMADESGLISLRSKQWKLRLLDQALIKSGKTNWQLLNLGLPLVALVLFGVVFNIVRRRRFS